jgi:hypothetical protein
MTSTSLMNVDAFNNQLPDAAFASLNPESESLADGIGQSYGIIGYKGKVWTLRYRGENYTFTRPDDGSPSAFLDCIVLRSASYRSKSFYKDGYQEGVSGLRPTCASLNGVTPDADAPEPQASACSLCPRNEFKQHANGRKGKDCSDYKRLAVLILPSQSAPLFGGSALMEPVFLRVPAASLNDLATLGEAMSKKGFHYATYITRIGFDVEKPHPQMTFRAVQKLSAQEAPLVIEMREDPQAYRITGENEVGKASPSANNAVSGGQPALQQTAPANTASQTSTATVQTAAPATTTSPSENDEIAKLKAQLAAAEAKSKAAAAAQNVPANEPINTGFGNLSGGVVGLGTNQPVIEVSGAGQLAGNDADTGPADESDVDLDARVAGLLQR